MRSTAPVRDGDVTGGAQMSVGAMLVELELNFSVV
jgi:hypothetical protein